ncbi:ABC transporter ATP-binding protein [Treponema sp.]|uniref:ABC transporter ATP-binding protein n=1 Tax=Treponema sp. TaxID=166 RepID=UPI00298EC10A|nr:ABC transporter ATP-binding protein [Treponema sp.]
MIEIEHIYKSFDSRRGKLNLFSDFNMTVKDGTFLGIQGKSGAGKSTLLSIIAGLQKPDSGSVKIDCVDICALSDKKSAAFRNQNIGFISQEQSFLENFTVLDNVRLPSYISGSKHTRQNDEQISARAIKLLTNLGIEHLSSCYPREVSGGENHRVLIARALINDPKLILADEPTESVDAERTEEIIKIFRDLADHGKTVVLVTHDNDALKLCDEVLKV